MSPEMITIIGVGIALLAAQLSVAGLLVTLMIQSEKRNIQRIDRLEDRMNRQFEQMQGEMNRRFEQMQGEMNRQFEQMQGEMNRRFDRLEDQTNQRFEQMQGEMNRRFDGQDERVRGLEQGQARLSGQFSELKDFLSHQSGPE